MAEYWRVSPRFWPRTKGEGWTDDERLFALYLLTTPHRTTEGLYHLPLAYVSGDMKWPVTRVTQTLSALTRKGFCQYDEQAEIVFLPKAMEYQRPDNENQQKHAIEKLRDLPETPLFAGLIEAAEAYTEPFAKALREAFPKGYGKPLALALALSQAPKDSSSSDADDGFLEFWKTYPRKIGKAECQKRWRRMPVADRKDATRAAGNLSAYVKDCSVELQYVPHPSTFIGPKRQYDDWKDGRPDGYEGSPSKGEQKPPTCPECRKTRFADTPLTYDEAGAHCPVCEWRAGA
jgi:hypothetical protein